MIKEQKVKSIKRILAVLAIVCCLAACSFVTASANQTAFTKVIQSEIAKVNNERDVAQKSRFVMHLTATDFMTSENHTNDNWVNADDGNVDVSDVNLDEYDLCNFLLDKNLSVLIKDCEEITSSKNTLIVKKNGLYTLYKLNEAII